MGGFALVVGLLNWFVPFAPLDISPLKWLKELLGGREESLGPAAGTNGGQGLATDPSSSATPELDPPALTDLGAVDPLPPAPQAGKDDTPAVPRPMRSAAPAPVPAGASAPETPSALPPLATRGARFRRRADPEPILPGAMEAEVPPEPIPAPTLPGAESAVPERNHFSDSYQEGIVVAVARIEIKRHAAPLGTLYSPTVPRGFYLGGCKLTLGAYVDPSGHAVVEGKEILGQISPFVIARAVQIVEHTLWSPALDQEDQAVADTVQVVFRWD